MLCPPQIHTLNSTCQFDDIRRWAFGRRLGHEDVGLRDGINILTKETRDLLGPSARWGHSERTAFCEAGGRLSADTGSADAFFWDSWTARTLTNKLLFKPRSLCYSVLSVWVDTFPRDSKETALDFGEWGRVRQNTSLEKEAGRIMLTLPPRIRNLDVILANAQILVWVL